MTPPLRRPLRRTRPPHPAPASWLSLQPSARSCWRDRRSPSSPRSARRCRRGCGSARRGATATATPSAPSTAAMSGARGTGCATVATQRRRAAPTSPHWRAPRIRRPNRHNRRRPDRPGFRAVSLRRPTRASDLSELQPQVRNRIKVLQKHPCRASLFDHSRAKSIAFGRILWTKGRSALQGHVFPVAPRPLPRGAWFLLLKPHA